jgi:CHAT domain-containing protein
MGEATVLSNIGLIHWQKGEWVQHARYQLRAFRLRREIGDQIGMADSYYFLAHLPHYIGYNNPGYVTTYYRKSVELSRRIGYAWGERVATEAWHRYLANSFDVASIRTKGAGRTEDRSGEARLFDLSTRADVAFQEERWGEAARLFEEVYRMADSLDYYSMKRGSLRWKAAALRRGHRFAAASATLSALEALVEDDPRAVNRDDVTLQKAHLLLDTGRHTRAEAHLRPLADTYDSLYVATLAQANPSQAYERAAGAVHAMRRQIYLRLVQAALRRSPEAVLQYVERERRLPFWGEAPAGSRHRDAYGRFVRLLEELDTDPDRFHQVQELEAALGEVYQDRLAEETILSRVAPSRERSSLRAATPLQGALREGEVFAEYFVTDAEVVVIAVRRDTLHVQSVPIRRSALEAAVRVFRGTVRRGVEDPEDTLWRPVAHRLYDVLLTPLIENGLLHEGDRLLVAPHNSLRWVPVHALLPSPGSSSPFVIERYGVSYVPSGTDLVRARRQPQRTLRSLYAVAPVSRALPETQREIQQLADLASFDVEGDAAHRPLSTELWHQFRDHDVVHIASHARMNAHFPLYSSIELSDRRLDLHELVGRDLATPLVVLSACETGREGGAVNGVPTGADRVSFPRAFLAAGVENVVASYWRVEDAATADLMAAFYRALDATAPNGHAATAPSTSDRVAAALVQAQRRVIQRRRADGQPTHPFYWAGFYLTRTG